VPDFKIVVRAVICRKVERTCSFVGSYDKARDMLLAAQASHISLKTNIVSHVGSIPSDWYHGRKILEARAVLFVVDDTVLRFSQLAYVSPEIQQSFAVHIMSWSFTFHPATRKL
jgi:hypothetical protein